MNFFSISKNDLNDLSVHEGLFRRYYINSQRVEFVVSNILLPKSFLELDSDINEETLFKLVFLKYSYLKVEVFSKDKSEIELGHISGDILEYSGSFENNYINIVVCCESVVVEKFFEVTDK
ncbi:hypothetical protein [Acinetobacter proteolyticus]|uniref:Uncharacterized protein n=1 Tax=Acinetobacter proteolyticus TaxID=1776741 RepID=A0A2N0WBA6_9GAMM|nr:hypothetical protein [Acinetobacter proteolyticus]PKF31723.1 hypothetical protein CW311_15850 [Acinetobacter proteolyticus]